MESFPHFYFLFSEIKKLFRNFPSGKLVGRVLCLVTFVLNLPFNSDL